MSVIAVIAAMGVVLVVAALILLGANVARRRRQARAVAELSTLTGTDVSAAGDESHWTEADLVPAADETAATDTGEDLWLQAAAAEDALLQGSRQRGD